MNTKPVEDILPRKPEKHFQIILDNCSKAVDEVVNFGTHLLLWDVETKRDGIDNNIPSIFFRNILELGDSISVLLKNSLIDPGKIQLRALIENHFQLLYMLEKNEKERALSFMVWRAKKDLKYYKQFISDNPTSKQLKSKLSKDSMKLNFESFVDKDETKEAITAKMVLLNKPELKEVHKEYMRTSKNRKTKNPMWYSLFDGPADLEGLSTYLEKTIAYEFLYRKYSENSHITGVQKGFAISGKDKAQIIQIRDFEHLETVFTMTISYLIECYTEFVKKRIPNKMPEHKKWYSDFKEPYAKISAEAKIKYEK